VIRLLHALRTTAALAALAVCVLLALVMLAPALAGFDRYVIVSGSMTGTYDEGSIVYAKTVPVGDLREGDVITYAPPAGMSPTELVTHRITHVGRGADGERTFRTRGDANPSVDPWTFRLTEARQARVAFGVPYAGYLVAAIAVREVRMVVIGIPAALVALFVLGGMVADARRDARQRRTGAAVAA